jgi:hypothetical protein
MSGPPVKTKRAGDLAATSPNCFELGDHSAIVCSAQTGVSTLIRAAQSSPRNSRQKKKALDPGGSSTWLIQARLVSLVKCGLVCAKRRSRKGCGNARERTVALEPPHQLGPAT